RPPHARAVPSHKANPPPVPRSAAAPALAEPPPLIQCLPPPAEPGPYPRPPAASCEPLLGPEDRQRSDRPTGLACPFSPSVLAVNPTKERQLGAARPSPPGRSAPAPVSGDQPLRAVANLIESGVRQWKDR